MEKVKIAVFVSGGGTNLQALLNAQKRGLISSGEICLVVADRAGVYALQRAKKAGIETAVVNRKAEMEKHLDELVKKKDIGLIVLAGFLSILSADFVRKYDHRIINIHPSLIPSFCGEGYYGLHVHEAALKKGVKVSGATVHYVNEVPDGGEIIMQKAVKVKEDDSPETLQKRIMRLAEWQILPKAVEEVAKSIRGKEL